MDREKRIANTIKQFVLLFSPTHFAHESEGVKLVWQAL